VSNAYYTVDAVVAHVLCDTCNERLTVAEGADYPKGVDLIVTHRRTGNPAITLCMCPQCAQRVALQILDAADRA
jgi:hypothetical protein